ncbi:hypothetical protein BCR32DRAFT_248395 [Anaeromyces robustus]|uniref:Zinc finger PHD-type domain-containing protein n=1 Tax=Anaeromyces robustus TaxID=1754192 RepID=A0A1Y1WTW2_9FUNG|nr:hypothetical protein BCR32DRAFT_248395 [Anaeromyces robustus]|eukprot:ORX76845.1 hypothetical protein BCR32DRAFT_248395 [Anaeromyces robustus]
MYLHLLDNPLPNKFYDIYSIFSYLFKNSNINFGNYNEFKSKFLIKDTKSKNGNIPNEDLQSFMKHFVLRREKNVFYTEYQYEPDKVNTSYEVEDEYDDLNSFIVNDEDYLEEEDIDTNDKNYKNLNFEEDSFKLYSNTNSNLEEENINDELQELRIDNEISKRINDNLINPDQYTKHDHIIDSSNKNMIITTTNNNYDIYENKQCYNKNHHYNEKKCNHCYHIITKNDACISCSNCNNWEHIECSGIPYDKNNIEYFPEIDEYYCHICRKLGHWNYFYLLTKDNKDNKIYDQSLDSKLIKDSNFILQSLQSENLYNIPNNENDDTQINIENNNSDFLNVTGKFGMETSINNLSSIIKEKSFENILYNSNSHENIDNEIINETFLIYQKYIKEFKIYLDKNDQINALNSLLKANKLNSNDLNLHWWIIKIIINLNINISEIIK